MTCIAAKAACVASCDAVSLARLLGLWLVERLGEAAGEGIELRDLAVFATSEPANLPPARPVIVSPVKAGLSARTRMTAGGSAAAARDDSTRVKVRFSLDVRAGYGAERRWPQQTNSM